MLGFYAIENAFVNIAYPNCFWCWLLTLSVLREHSYALPPSLEPLPIPSFSAASADTSDLLQSGLLLADQLIQDSLKPSSKIRYSLGFHRWKRFSSNCNIPALPADPRHVAACLALVASETQSVSAVEGVYAAISHEHRLRGLPSPTGSPVIALLMRSVRRNFGKPTCQVKPLNPVMIREMVDYLRMPEHGPSAIRYIFCCSLFSPFAILRTPLLIIPLTYNCNLVSTFLSAVILCF